VLARNRDERVHPTKKETENANEVMRTSNMATNCLQRYVHVRVMPVNAYTRGRGVPREHRKVQTDIRAAKPAYSEEARNMMNAAAFRQEWRAAL